MRILYSLTFSAFCDDDKIKLKCKGEQTGKISILQLNSQPLEIRPSLHLHVGNKLLPDDGAKNQNWGTFWCAFIYLLNIISQISDLAYFHAEIQRDEIGAKWKIALLQKHSKSFLNINSLHKGQKWQQSRNCRESVAKVSRNCHFKEILSNPGRRYGHNSASISAHLYDLISWSSSWHHYDGLWVIVSEVRERWPPPIICSSSTFCLSSIFLTTKQCYSALSPGTIAFTSATCHPAQKRFNWGHTINYSEWFLLIY